MVTSLWQGIGAVVYAGGLLWTCDAQPTGFGNSNDIPTSVNLIHVLDPTTTPYPKVVKTIDLRQYIGPHIKNVRKVKKSLDGTKVYVCTFGWYGEYADRGTHGNIDTSFGIRFSASGTFDPPGINGFSPNFLDLTITISGAADPNNNGTFPINPDGTIVNPLASTDANNGSLVWHLNTPGQNVIGSPCGYVFIIDASTKNVLGLAQLKNGIIADGTLNGKPSYDKGDGSAARDCVDDGNGNLWVINASGGGAGDGISLLEKFNIATVISNGPGVQTHSTAQFSILHHGEEIVYDSGFLWTASGYVGDTTVGGGTGKGIVTRINPSNGSMSTYQDSTYGIFGMISDSTGRSPFPGAIYAFSTNTFNPNAHKFFRFDPSQFPNPGFRTHTIAADNTDGGGICSDGTNLWMSPRIANSGQADFFILNPANLTIINQVNTFASTPSDGGLGCWALEFDGTYIWGARRGFSGRIGADGFIASGLSQLNANTLTFPNATQDNVMQLFNGQFLGWVMQAKSSTDGLLYTWDWPYADFTGIGYPGPGTPLEIAVLDFSPVDSIGVVMQARDSSSGNLVTWITTTEDFAGAFYPGPGSPQQTTVLSRNLAITPDNLQITMQAVDSITNQIVTWLSSPSSPDFAGSGYPGPGTPSQIAVSQVKWNI